MTWSSDWLQTAAAEASTRPGAAAWRLDELEQRGLEEAAKGAGQAAVAADAERARREQRAAAERQAELEEMYNRGFEDGQADALRREGARIASARSALEAAVAAARAGESTWTENAREHIAALAVTVARHVIGRELRGDPHGIADLARRALMHFPVKDPVQVRVNPEDLSVLTAAVSADGGEIMVAPGRDVKWVADPTIEPGGCVVEGRRRVVDGRVDHVLERIFRKLLDD